MKGVELIIHNHDCDHNLWVTMLEWVHISDGDRGDFRLWCDIDTSSYTLRTTKLLGGGGGGGHTGFTPSFRLSVRPSHIPCLLCSTYSFSWIYFIFIHLIKQIQKVCRVWSFMQNLYFWQFFKICNFVLFWLGIWCESLVWVGNHGAAGGISECRRSSCSSCICA